MKVRRLNGEGVSEFSGFVNSLRNGEQQNTPTYLLDGEESSEAIVLDLSVIDKQFESRYEMGVYLVELFSDQDIQQYIGDTGFWSWFALLWFDQLCPERKGVRKPSRDYNYVLSTKYNHRPRHAVYMTWQLVARYGKDSAFLLSKDMATRGEITEQLMARQDNLSSEGVMQLASNLYFDPETGGFKKGAAARTGAGCVSRYLSWLEQLKVNYDLFLMTKSDLENLLPSEFQRFQEISENQ